MIYTGSFLDEVPAFDKARTPQEKPVKNPRFVGVTIEIQDSLDDIDQPNFGIEPLEKGRVYKHEAIYRFRC